MFTIIWRVLTLLFHEKKLIVLLILANIFFAVLILLEPIFFRYVIDTLIDTEWEESWGFDILIPTLILWLVIGLATIFLKLFITVATDRFAHRQFTHNVFNFYNHIQSLSTRFHLDSSSGQLVKKITRGTDGMFRVHLDMFRRILPSVFTIIFLIPIVLYFNFELGLFVVCTWIVSWCLSWYIATQTFKKQESIEDIYSNMSAHYGDTFSNMTLLKSFGLWKFKQDQLAELTDLRIKKQFPVLNWWGAIISFSQVIKIIVSLWIIFFWSYLFFEWRVSIWEIVMFLSFSLIFLSAIEDLTWSFESIFWNIAPIKEYFTILDTPVEVQDADNAIQLKDVEWYVKFENIHFSYDGKRQVLTDINIDVKKGEKIAFVGHTGSWKTTMTHMLLRFFEPQSWDIKIDNISIFDVTQESLRKNIWVVFQDNSLFNTTILENIRLDSQASRDDIERVAEKSHSTEFIGRLSDGLDTLVWERWVKLSWGEKQRLAIARAFLKNAPILILDEATSALDAETEKYLQSSFDELMEGRTTFIIAHRLSTIMKANRIFVFDQGKIVEQGTYQELLSLNWRFKNLVAAQTQGFIE